MIIWRIIKKKAITANLWRAKRRQKSCKLFDFGMTEILFIDAAFIIIENKRTFLQTLTGQVRINNVLVSEGEYYPAATSDNTNSGKPVNNNSKSSGISPLLILGVLGALGAAALVALSASGGNNSDTPIISPTR